MLLDLFLCFVQVGLFSIGGGYAAMPMIQAKAVEHYHWLTMGEFTDLMTIAEMTRPDHRQFRDVRRHPHGGHTGRAGGDDGLYSAVADYRVAALVAV